MKHLYFIIFALVIGACSKPDGTSVKIKFLSEESNVNPAPMLKSTVPTHELPKDIFNNIREDQVFSSLKLKEANKFNKSSKTYYDLTFEDEEQFKIIATFDELGNLVSL